MTPQEKKFLIIIQCKLYVVNQIENEKVYLVSIFVFNINIK